MTQETLNADDCRDLFRGVLRQAFRDLNGLLSGAYVQSEDAQGLSANERRELLASTTDWFLNEDPSPCSLDVVCSALGIEPDAIRSRVRRAIAGTARFRMRRANLWLRKPQIEYIRAALDRGETTTRIAAHLGIDAATVRKRRIRFRREQQQREAA